MKKKGKYLALLLTCTVFLAGLSGCAALENKKADSPGTAENAAASGTEDAEADTAENEATATEVANAVSDTADREQTVSVKAYADGTPREVKIKNSGDDLEEKGDPALLPFAVHIRYFLDGKEMTPQEIAGKSGHVRIVFAYTDIAAVTETVDGQAVDTQVPFVFLSAAMLPTEHFRNVQVENGDVTTFKKSQIAYGYAMPGWKEALAVAPLEDKLNGFDIDVEIDLDDEDGDGGSKDKKDDTADGDGEDPDKDDEDRKIELPETVEIEADVTDFELDFTVTVVTNGILADGESDTLDDIDKLTEGLEDFAEAGDALQEGTEKLADGAGEFDDYLKQYTDGVSALADGALQLAHALEDLDGAVRGADFSKLTGNMDLAPLQEALAGISADGTAIADQLGGVENLKAAAQSLRPEELQSAVEEAVAGVAGSSAESAAAAAYDVVKDNENLTEEEKQAVSQAAGAAAAAAAAEGAKEAAKAVLAGYGIDTDQVDSEVLTTSLTDLQARLGVISEYAKQFGEGSDLEKQLEGVSSKLGELKNGIAALAEGGEGLAQAVAQVGAAGGELYSGYGELTDGIGKLADGVQEFNEKGIQKIADLAGDELRDMVRHFRAMKKADEGYTSFDGSRAKSVRFLVETDEIEKEG